MENLDALENNSDEKFEIFGLREIFLSFFALFFFLIIWYLINDYSASYEKLKDISKKNMSISSLQVYSQFEQIRNILFIMSADISEKRVSLNRLPNYFTSNGVLISNIESFVYSEPTGKIIATSLESSLPTSIDNFKFYSNSLVPTFDSMTYSSPLKSKMTNGWTTAFNHKIYNTKNNYEGVISAIIPMTTWYNFFKKQINYDREEIALVKLSDCTIIGSSTQVDENFTSYYINQTFCEKYLRSNNLSSTFIESETSDVISYNIFPEYKIALVSYSPHQIITQPFIKKILIILFVSIFLILGYWQLINYQIKTEKRLKEKKIQMLNTSKLATLGEMASGIAHEVNNPLSIVRGRLQQIIRNVKQPDEYSIQSIEKSASTALIATERIQNIVSSMKSISRNNSNDQYENISLEQLFQHSLIFCNEKIKSNNINFEIEAIPNVFIKCRESEISQVILNLISNASDAIENLQDKWIKINFVIDTNNRNIYIIITDSGNGIPQDIVEKIMQPFFTTKPVGKGTGLGLSISAKILKDHNGKLEYISSSANTQFKITLPYI